MLLRPYRLRPTGKQHFMRDDLGDFKVIRCGAGTTSISSTNDRQRLAELLDLARQALVLADEQKDAFAIPVLEIMLPRGIVRGREDHVPEWKCFLVGFLRYVSVNNDAALEFDDRQAGWRTNCLWESSGL